LKFKSAIDLIKKAVYRRKEKLLQKELTKHLNLINNEAIPPRKHFLKKKSMITKDFEGFGT
jgi:hypothetical protein